MNNEGWLKPESVSEQDNLAPQKYGFQIFLSTFLVFCGVAEIDGKLYVL